jgi:hypothetical protein
VNVLLVGMLLDSAGDQVQSESIHLAFLAIVGGASIICSAVVGAISFLLRRDLKRSEDAKRAFEESVNKSFAELKFQHAALDEELDKLDHRHGCEISDVKIAVAPLFTKAGIDQPNYPTR